MWPLQPLNSSVNIHHCTNILLVIFPSGDMNKVHKHNSFFFICQTNGYSWQVAIFKLSVVTWKKKEKSNCALIYTRAVHVSGLGDMGTMEGRECFVLSLLLNLCTDLTEIITQGILVLCSCLRLAAKGYHSTPSSWVGHCSIWNRERENLVEGFHAIFFNFSD